MKPADSNGYTLIETLVAVFLFAVLSAGFYSVMFSGVRGSETTENVVRISEEVRLGFNRMVRDTREAARIAAIQLGPNPDASFRIAIDFNANGTIEEDLGEVETYSYDEERQAIFLTSSQFPTNPEVLMAGVIPVDGRPIFDYSSNRLEFDANGDGTATWQELDSDGDGPDEYHLYSNVSFAMRVVSEDRNEDFYGEAQLRNLRTPTT